MIVLKLSMKLLQLPHVRFSSPWAQHLASENVTMNLDHQFEQPVRDWLIAQGHSGEVSLMDPEDGAWAQAGLKAPCVEFSDDQHHIATLFKLTWGGS